jgi:uncharacterized protein (TIGR02757 family)
VSKIKNFEYLQELLEKEVLARNTCEELSLHKPDPLYIARQYNNEYIALICALFAYGNAKQILLFLSKLDFSLLDTKLDEKENLFENLYYRFQNSLDIQQIFKTFALAKKQASLEEVFYEGYKKNQNMMEGLKNLLEFLYSLNPYRSFGYEFLLGKIPQNTKSTYKRWNMFFRWMVRKDNLDLGLWKKVDKKDLLLPLDTHTFRVGRSLGLVKRKTYDFNAVLEITQNLRKFDPSDPVKYDFALYRIGQEKLLQLGKKPFI